MTQAKMVPVLLVCRIILHSTFSGPAFVICCCRYGMRWRAGRQHVHNETFVVSLYRKIHFPLILWRPVPIENILAILVPVKFYFGPEFIDFCCQCFLFSIALPEILTHT